MVPLYQVSLDIMAYHASSTVDDADHLAQQPVPSALTMQLQSFSFTDMVLGEDDTLRVSILRTNYKVHDS